MEQCALHTHKTLVYQGKHLLIFKCIFRLYILPFTKSHMVVPQGSLQGIKTQYMLYCASSESEAKVFHITVQVRTFRQRCWAPVSYNLYPHPKMKLLLNQNNGPCRLTGRDCPRLKLFISHHLPIYLNGSVSFGKRVICKIPVNEKLKNKSRGASRLEMQKFQKFWGHRGKMWGLFFPQLLSGTNGKITVPPIFFPLGPSHLSSPDKGFSVHFLPNRSIFVCFFQKWCVYKLLSPSGSTLENP